jgi:hypothetical protein
MMNLIKKLVSYFYREVEVDLFLDVVVYDRRDSKHLKAHRLTGIACGNGTMVLNRITRTRRILDTERHKYLGERLLTVAAEKGATVDILACEPGTPLSDHERPIRGWIGDLSENQLVEYRVIKGHGCRDGKEVTHA